LCFAGHCIAAFLGGAETGIPASGSWSAWLNQFAGGGL